GLTSGVHLGAKGGMVMIRIGRLLGLAISLFLLTGQGRTQSPAVPSSNPRSFENVVKKIEVAVVPSTAARGETVTWMLTIELAPGWHTYPLRQVDPAAKDNITKIDFPATAGVVPVGKCKEPTFLSKAEPAA